jgi:DNA adenine methylase
LFFKIAPERAVLSDINGELIGFYKTVSEQPLEVYRRFVRFARKREAYYKLRKQYPTITDDAKKSAVFYYLNKNCFNGLYRTNRAGGFNVPFSDSRVGRYPSEEEFLKSCQALARAEFISGDFADVVDSILCAGDFVYLDPPYASSQRLPFREYHPNSFAVNDINRLQQLLKLIDQRGANFLLTYANCPAIQPVAKGWISSTCRVRRNISGFSNTRRMATEIIITNVEDAS